MVPNLGKLIKLRSLYAYGAEEDYLDDPHLIGWVRRGDKEHENSALAVVMSNTDGGTKCMAMGPEWAGHVFKDVLGTATEPVVIDEEGYGEFTAPSMGMSIWCTEEAFENLVIHD